MDTHELDWMHREYRAATQRRADAFRDSFAPALHDAPLGIIPERYVRAAAAQEVAAHMTALDKVLPPAPGRYLWNGSVYLRTGDGRVVPCADDINVSSLLSIGDPGGCTISGGTIASTFGRSDIAPDAPQVELSVSGIRGDTLNWSHIDTLRLPWRKITDFLATADADTLQRLHEQVAPPLIAALRDRGVTDRAAIDAAVRVVVAVLGAVVLEGRQE